MVRGGDKRRERERLRVLVGDSYKRLVGMVGTGMEKMTTQEGTSQEYIKHPQRRTSNKERRNERRTTGCWLYMVVMDSGYQPAQLSHVLKYPLKS